MPESCMIYKLGEDLYVYSTGVTESGWGLTIEPFFKVSGGASDAVLGQLILLAAGCHRSSIPDPSKAEASDKGMIRFAGVRSWAAFSRSVVGFSKDTVRSNI